VTKLDLKENTIIIYRVLDVLFKCYPNLAYSHKKGMSLRKVMKKYSYNEYPSVNTNEAKKEGSINYKYLSSDLGRKNSGTNLKNDLIGVKNENEEKLKKDTKIKNEKNNTTQRKDIFYNSFKNIKERHHYKEDRINVLQHQKKKIVNELKEQNKNNGKNKKK
jgi:hypothetical protein